MYKRRNIRWFVALIICSTISFVIGHDWPYLLPPSDFGCYSLDGEYKYVISKDPTRLCQTISILKEGEIVFHTKGYLGRGWHDGKFSLKVSWGNSSNNIYIVDGRGTYDVYVYDDVIGTWKGPYWLNSPHISKSGEYELSPAFYSPGITPDYCDSTIPLINQNDVPKDIIP